MSILVIVESPSKIKSISSYLGSNYEVIASMGHIRQLSKDRLGFDIDNNFEPEFENMPELISNVRFNVSIADAYEAQQAFEWTINIYDDLYRRIREAG